MTAVAEPMEVEPPAPEMVAQTEPQGVVPKASEPEDNASSAPAAQVPGHMEPATPRVRVAPAMNTQTSAGSGLKPAALPYQLAESELSPVATSTRTRGRTLEIVLWVVAALLLIGAALIAIPFVFPNLIPNFGGTGQTEATATNVAVVVPTSAPSPTVTVLPTDEPTLVAAPTTAPIIIPTPPADGTQFSSLPETNLSGWVANDQDPPHYADVNLHAGTFQGKELSSIIQFNLRNYPKDSKILFAALELTGRDASRLGQDGQWQVELVENTLGTDWKDATSEQIGQAKSLGTIGAPFQPSDLGQGRLNRIILSDTERQLLEQQFASGNAVFRLRGPSGTSDNLFTWESGVGGSPLVAPTLHLVVVPGQFVIVTNTPVPQNVLTAASYVVRGTDQAKKLGTPTSFPPGVATATPGGDQVIVPAETAVPQNVETAIARTEIARAIAATTGTYTPTPPGQVILFPTNTPIVFTTGLATATPIPPDADLLTVPIDYSKCKCQGRILALSTRFGGNQPSPIMLEADGTELGKLSGDLYYKLAMAREPYSPDRTKHLIYPNDPNGVQQIAYEETGTGQIVFLTNFSKGIAYDAAWSPDGSAIAFVSTERANTDEIWVYDFGTQTSKRITTAPENLFPLSKHPSWSPDSQRIVFWSSRSGSPQLWVMNRDGSDLHNISNNGFAETDPVWVK